MSATAEVFSYYPGCLAAQSAREYDASIRRLAGLVDASLEDINDWNCCGAGVVQQADEAAGRALARRNLDRAGGDRVVVSGCPICVARLREAASDEAACHVLDLLARPDLRERIAAKIGATGEKRPVGSLKVACFYGCQFPQAAGEQTGAGEDASTPLEALMTLAGASVVTWRGSRRCCGGYRLFSEPEVGFETLRKIFRDFTKSGADAIVTACPHCHFNLDAFQYTVGRRQKRALEVPVLHFTEVLALAMNLEAAEKWLDRHVTSPFGLLDRLYVEEEKRKRAEGRARKTKPKKEQQ